MFQVGDSQEMGVGGQEQGPLCGKGFPGLPLCAPAMEERGWRQPLQGQGRVGGLLLAAIPPMGCRSHRVGRGWGCKSYPGSYAAWDLGVSQPP